MDRAALVDRLVAAGCARIEAVSFVSERAVPAMAGATEVLRLLSTRESFHLTALVPNLRGADSALEAGVDEITVTISASEAYNERNVRRSIAESLREVERVCERSAQAGVPVDGVVSCAFGSPYEGDLAAGDVNDLCKRLVDAGCTAFTLADTTGMATPRLLAELLDLTGTNVGLHLHETRGTALVNAYAGLLAGVRRFDTAVGGLGGSPFAAGAGGNLASEDLVALLDDLGVPSGIDLERLIAVARSVAEMVGHDVPSRISAVGPRTRLSRAEAAEAVAEVAAEAEPAS
jgi:hydroxymethylglutaryl-CoA lyase